jgi:hypothetical protein
LERIRNGGKPKGMRYKLSSGCPLSMMLSSGYRWQRWSGALGCCGNQYWIGSESVSQNMPLPRCQHPSVSAGWHQKPQFCPLRYQGAMLHLDLTSCLRRANENLPNSGNLKRLRPAALPMYAAAHSNRLQCPCSVPAGCSMNDGTPENSLRY